MHTVLKSLAGAASAVLLAGAANASLVTFQSASSFGPDQPSAAAYRSVVTQALAAPGAHSTVVPSYDALTSQSLFGGFNNNLALHTTVDFSVSAAQAGSWSLRIGGDFGYGGAVYLDGTALGFKSTAMWWNFSWIDSAQSFQFFGVPITAGTHKLELFALEDCCDGGQSGMFSRDGVTFVIFGAGDGLATPVPEVPMAPMLVMGLGVVAVVSRLRRQLAHGAATA